MKRTEFNTFFPSPLIMKMKINDHVSCCSTLEAGERKNTFIRLFSSSYSSKKYIIQGFDGAERGKRKGKTLFLCCGEQERQRQKAN